MQAIIFCGFFLHIFLENLYYCRENKWVMSQVILPMYLCKYYIYVFHNYTQHKTKQIVTRNAFFKITFIFHTLQRDNFVLNLIAQKFLVPLSYYN